MDRKRVLVVDDDSDVLDVVESRLKRAGIACETSLSAEDALELMGRNLYVVVVSDIHMPGMDGVELISRLKRMSPLVQVVMLSSDNVINQVIACADRGAIDFFSKTEGLTGLVQSVQEALDRTDRWAAWMGVREVAAGAGRNG
jgi:two-component system NtrC family response regulator/two-component system response regulator AtoC